MPELPEVETVRRILARDLVGRRVGRVVVGSRRLRQPLPGPALRALAGDAFTATHRRGKFLLLGLRSGRTVLVHLGMTGNLILRPAGQKHDHVVFELDQGPPLVFSDSRRFGLVLVLEPEKLLACPHLNRLGVEPLTVEFDAAYLRSRCRGRRRPIKSLIMDGGVVTGVGNIYASEALFRAGIRPATPAASIGLRRAERLVRAVKEVLRQSIRRGGTTISDYQAGGAGGGYQQRLAVYGRAGEGCLVCDRPVRSQVLAGRSTYYCSRCQR